MKDFPIADSFAVTRKAQRFDGDIQTELVSILETINYGPRDTVDAYWNSVDWVHIDSLTEGRNIKTIDLHRRCTKAQPRVSSPRNSQVYDSRYLSRDAVEGQRRNQTHDRLRGFGRHYGEVWITELVSGREPIEPTCESHKPTVLYEPVKRRGMNAPHQGLTRSHHAAVLKEGIESALDIASLNHDG